MKWWNSVLTFITMEPFLLNESIDPEDRFMSYSQVGDTACHDMRLISKHQKDKECKQDNRL